MEKEKNSEMKFRPLSEGLGINHFSDGLPYSASPPPHKAGRRQGVSFQFPPPRAPKLPAAAAAQTAQEPKEEPTVAPLSRPAPFSLRICAFFLDAVFFAALYTLVAWGGLVMGGLRLEAVVSSGDGPREASLSLGLLFAVLCAGYFLLQETVAGTTLGKALFRMRRARGMKGLRQWP